MTIYRMPLAALGTVAFLSSVLVLVNPAASAQMNPMGTRTLPSETSTSGAGDNPQAARDRLFIHDAAEESMGQSQLSQLALQKSSNDDIKKLAQMVVDDNSALMNSFEPIGKSLGTKLPKKPSKRDEAEYAKLNNLSGAEFDKAYLDHMAKNDHKALDEFRQEAALASTPSVKDVAAKGVNMLQGQTDRTDQLVHGNGSAAPAQ